jgi:phosphate transport system protein
MRAARGEFDRQLEGIEAKVIELFGIVVEDLPEAAGAFVGGGGGSGRVLAAREQVIDALYLEVEGLACKMMLLQAPVGPDLRFLLTVLRVVPELERSHDLVMQIAGRGALIRVADLSPHSRGLAGRMGGLQLTCGGRRRMPGTGATGPPHRLWACWMRRWASYARA